MKRIVLIVIGLLFCGSLFAEPMIYRQEKIKNAQDTNISGEAGGNLLIYDGSDTWDNKVMGADGSIDASGNLTVNNDSHDHTGSTISGIDISEDTNLAVTSPVVLTDDTLSIPQATTSVDGYVIQADWDSWTDHVADNTQAHSDYLLNSGVDTMLGNLTITSTNPAIILDEATATDTDFWIANVSDSAGDDDDLFQIGKGTSPGTTPYLTMNKDGNVGIGTTGPTEPLDIQHATQADMRLLANTNADSNRVLLQLHHKNTAGATKGYSLRSSGATNILEILDADGSTKMYFDNAGNVGIGTTGPSVKLQVMGGNFGLESTRRFGSGVNFGTPTSAADGYINFYSGTDGSMTLTTTYNGPAAGGMNFQTGGTATNMRIDKSGNVGIGTTAPATVLDVVGGIASRNTAVTIANAATTFAITSNVVTVTGDGGGNTVATITGGVSGQLLTLIFVDALVVVTDTDAHTANTADLSAAFTSADDTTLTLVSDGTSWYEVSRSVN